ncbi:Crp/Fnr family transcriptional regulator [Mucilaginibacter agri]|uniref:Cyclic nucleotide-binding domain-containing protein n=1 Tax=Mucilaginibacter agri TaxID=2695265 RepID=A0A965ZF18_9SPHI|nr:Crp/Fnr family transcriptional regulator [Mucilaginibacter agri]NCD68481.1 cyclic nucleotide-binding domain-containing protein [Mucilaginibacter agri]
MDSLKAKQNFRLHLEPYAVFTDSEWELFCNHLEFVSLKKKEYFVEAGKVCQHFGFVHKGSVRYFHVSDGTDITGYFSFENEFMSSYKSFLKQEPAVNYIQTLEDTELILISHKSLQQMLADERLAYKMERFGRLVAEYYLCCYEDRVAAFITQSPEERYLKLLETGRDILQRMPQHYVANFLGITPVSLSRIRRRILA